MKMNKEVRYSLNSKIFVLIQNKTKTSAWKLEMLNVPAANSTPPESKCTWVNKEEGIRQLP